MARGQQAGGVVLDLSEYSKTSLNESLSLVRRPEPLQRDCAIALLRATLDNCTRIQCQTVPQFSE